MYVQAHAVLRTGVPSHELQMGKTLPVKGQLSSRQFR